MSAHPPRVPPIVSFEGIDGAGKTTLVDAVAARMVAAGSTVSTVREFTSPFGPVLRRSVHLLLDPRTRSFAFAADRAWALHALEESAARVVLWDRFVHSAVALRLADARGEWDSPLVGLAQAIASAFPEPSLTIYLSCDAGLAAQRLSNAGRAVEATVEAETARLANQAAAFAQVMDRRGGSLWELDGSDDLGANVARILDRLDAWIRGDPAARAPGE